MNQENTNLRKRALLFAMMTAGNMLGACGREPAAVSAAGGNSGTSALPPANAPVNGPTVIVDQGAELSQVRNQEMVHALFYLSAPDVEAPIIFAVVRKENEPGSPVILKKVGSAAGMGAGWHVAQISDQRQEWVYAAACPPRHEVWGVLDAPGDSPAWQLTLVRSTDGGATWEFFAAVKKPSNKAIFAGFALAENGKGRLSMHLEDDTDGHAHGYYHYRTTDGGRTWAGPEVEGNDVAEADPAGADEKLPQVIKDAEQ